MRDKFNGNNDDLFSRDNYDDGFEFAGNSGGSYDLENFDDDISFDNKRQPESGENYDKIVNRRKSGVNADSRQDNPAADYGDGFDSQTGEDKAEQKPENVYDDDYSSSGMSKAKRTYNNANAHNNMSGGKKPHKKKGSFKIAVVLAVLAVICLIAAVIFAFSKCSIGKGGNTETTVPTTQRVTTAPVTQQITDAPVYTEPEPTEPEYTEPEQTEPVQTEPEPTEPVYTEPQPTEPQPTEPEYTEPVQTEPEYTEPQYEEPQTEVVDGE